MERAKARGALTLGSPSPAVDAAPPDKGFFREGLLQCLAKVELHALNEVRRLDEALADLRAENQQLRSQLAQRESSPVNPDYIALGWDDEQAHNGWRPSDCLKASDVDQSTAALTPRRSDAQRHSVCILSKMGRVQSRAERVHTVIVSEHPDRLTRQNSRAKVYKTSGWAQQVAKSPIFENATLMLVLLNALWIAIDLDLNGKPLLESPPLFQTVENFFIVIFLTEMVVRYLAYKDKFFIIYDRWFLFDAALVAVMIVESWLFAIVISLTQSEDYPGVGFISALRILRLLRVVRVARLCRVFPELQTMLSGMLAGIRSVLITAIILLAITYTFAILLRQLGVSSSWGAQSFSSVPQAVYTLLVSSMLPDNQWLLDEMGNETWYCAVIYFIFLLLTAITVMNMLVGVLCDDIFRVSHEEKEHRSIDNMSEKLLSILSTIDSDFNGFVSRSEFESMLGNDDAIRILSDVGVDVVALVGEVDCIFNSTGDQQLPFERFKKEVLQFRSSNLATLGSVTAIRRFMQDSIDVLTSKLDALELLVYEGMLQAHGCQEQRNTGDAPASEAEADERFEI